FLDWFPVLFLIVASFALQDLLGFPNAHLASATAAMEMAAAMGLIDWFSLIFFWGGGGGGGGLKDGVYFAGSGFPFWSASEISCIYLDTTFTIQEQESWHCAPRTYILITLTSRLNRKFKSSLVMLSGSRIASLHPEPTIQCQMHIAQKEHNDAIFCRMHAIVQNKRSQEKQKVGYSRKINNADMNISSFVQWINYFHSMQMTNKALITVSHVGTSNHKKTYRSCKLMSPEDRQSYLPILNN
ncbi:hypothetical protein ACJX0J_009912, partial [Zea mays]